MISRFSIVTLVIFLISIVFVIHPVSFRIPLPLLRRNRIHVNLTTAPIIAIAILWASQCLGATQIRDGIVGTDSIKPYNILILFITLAYMAVTLDISGVLQAAAFWVSNKGGSNTRRLYFYFYVMLTLLSGVWGNDPVILSGTAFLVYYTAAAELEPLAWLMSEFAAANTSSMVLFVGNPTNVVICEGFEVNNAAFTAYTILPFLACSVVCYIALTIQFRSKKHLPAVIPHSKKHDVRAALRDPLGAWVGSIVLLTCLVVIIIVSFFKVDVWMISLPFAVAKLIFDLAWDGYRFRGDRARLSKGDVETEMQPPTNGTVTFVLPPEKPGLQNGDSSTTSDRRRTTSIPLVEREATLVASVRTDKKFEPEPNKDADVARPPNFIDRQQQRVQRAWHTFSTHFPTLSTALPRLPFALVPFAFSQFILIEGLARQGWIDIFARWFIKASDHGKVHPTIWLVGVLGVLLCNVAGTNIGATILLTKIVRAADRITPFSPATMRAAAISLAVASNIGAVSFTFSASLAGLLWKTILDQKGVFIKQRQFAFWNLLPLFAMTGAGLAVVSAEMAVLY